jgi:hypothetical protein
MNIEIIEGRRLWETDQSVQITDKGITIQVEGVSETFDFTGFTEDGDYVLEDCMILPYNPVQSIKKDGDGITVSVFYDNPFEYMEDWTPPFERKGQTFKLIPTVDNDLGMASQAQKKIIYDECDAEMETKNKGLQSTVINEKIDCRNIDVLRVDQLIDLMESMGATDSSPVDYILYDNTVKRITLLQTKQIKSELSQNLMNMLYHKHSLYAQIDNIVQTQGTVAEIKAVIWQW